MRRMLVALGGIAVVALVALAAALLWAAAQLERPGAYTEDRTVIIPRGTGIAGIASRLEEAGVVEEPLLFQMGARWFAREEPLKAGEYRFAAGMSARAVMEKMIAGDTVRRRVTVAEGLTTSQIIALVAAAQGLEGELAPETRALAEGTLLPETYFYSWGDSRDGLVQQMKAAMDRLVQDSWARRGAEAEEVASPQELLVLASIVEKETGIAAERPRVARVFINRLKSGMRLQSDPTVIYALTQGKGPLGRPLSRADLAIDDPYNTYVKAGLPPGPIANPGKDSIEAVLQPAEGKELYFVADGTGGHAFAETLEEHNKNVAKLRRLEAARPSAEDEQEPQE